MEEELVAGAVAGEVHDDVHPLRHRQVDALRLHRLGQEVAVAGDDGEQRVLGAAALLRVAEEELVEARRAAVQDADAVLPRLDLEIGGDRAVDGEDVADHPVGVPVVEDHLRHALLVDGEPQVLEHQRDVVVGEARQPPAGGLVAGVLVVEEEVEAEQAGVDVGGGEVQPVVVVPEGGQLLARVEAGGEVAVVVVPELAGVDPVLGVAVALRGGVAVVQVGGGRGEGEAHLGVPHRRQLVEAAHQHRLAVARRVAGPGRGRRGAVALEAPHRGPQRAPAAADRVGRVGVEVPAELALEDLVEPPRQELPVALVGARVGRRVERRHRLHQRRLEHRLREGPGRRARALVRQHPRAVVRRAQVLHPLPVLGQRPPGREEAGPSRRDPGPQQVPARRHRPPPVSGAAAMPTSMLVRPT